MKKLIATDMNGTGINIGDMVKVYPLIDEKKDCKGVFKIKHIGRMNEGCAVYVWLHGVIGAWHPKALELNKCN